MRIANPVRVSALLVGLMLAAGASAQQYVYPAKGQTPDQQKKDEGACHTWAVDQSKYDPTNPPQQAAAPPPPQGATPGSGVRGAARGAVAGEIINGDASSGAAVGAVAARGASRRQNAAAGQQQQAAASQQSQAGMSAYQKARGACLEGRGYTVK
ncbi:hypothetical protein DSM104443_01678 [Usitatibacter rugosus]|uniref:YmgG-like glycine-zipper protein n=1 Tax=Usitatibacter rugosus TaxID=2732067 RepID=A0A6M4GVU8_9PROT|nr:hypothetical protein [Usitatibacter rugosus]QJR10614.1 hypothetical protein DSM104443_01678 [Usitatibacter rugosus]